MSYKFFSIEGNNIFNSLKDRESPQLGDRTECMFWNISANKWLSEGCRVSSNIITSGNTVCECDHLSFFTTILDKTLRVEKNTIKRMLEICSWIITSTSLVSAIIVLTMREKLLLKYGKIAKSRLPNRGESLNKIDVIILNQSICILITNFIVVFGLDFKNEKDYTEHVRKYIYEFLFMISFFTRFFASLFHPF